jgi:hypothetical protein
MRGRKSALIVLMTTAEKERLRQITRSTTAPQGLARRAHAVLCVSEGKRLTEASRLSGLTEKHVRKWVKRFLLHRLSGLNDLPGRGRKPFFPLGGGDARDEDRL